MKHPPITIALSFIWVAAYATVLAQDAATTAPAPQPPVCESSSGFGDFDFWLGEWNVYSNDEARQYQGTNSITKHYNGCLIKEFWQGAQGGGGFSINYYNSLKEEWRQVWVANGYSIDYTGGWDDKGAMTLNGHIYNYSQATETPFRGIWTPQADGSVIQHFDIYDDAQDNWNVWFEGLYVKKEGKQSAAKFTDEELSVAKFWEDMGPTLRNQGIDAYAIRYHSDFKSWNISGSGGMASKENAVNYYRKFHEDGHRITCTHVRPVTIDINGDRAFARLIYEQTDTYADGRVSTNAWRMVDVFKRYQDTWQVLENTMVEITAGPGDVGAKPDDGQYQFTCPASAG